MLSIRQFLPNWSQALLKRRVSIDRRYRPAEGSYYRPASRTAQAWRSLYVAALFEPDAGRMVERIDEAKKALVIRARELFQTTGDHLQEQSAIDDALQSLHALEQCTLHHICVQRQ
jgi:hypothetical protein